MQLQIEQNIDILKCPSCSSDMVYHADKLICIENRHEFEIVNGIPLLFEDDKCNERNLNLTQKTKLFYEEYPFPNYDDFENPESLISKAEASVFAKQINEELPFNTRILEVGCGTGQLTNYLSISNRFVIGTDISYSSLTLGNDFKIRNSLKRSSFYQMNLFKPVFKDESFHTVICNGVLHHTPDPFKGFQSIVKLLKRNGYVIIGLYNLYGRLATHLRRGIFNITGNRLKGMDPYLRRADVGDTKKHAWFMDQYKNPHETTHTMGEVLKWFDSTGVEFVTSIPDSYIPIDEYCNPHLFSKTRRSSYFLRLITQLGMILRFRNEGGFFIMIGRKK